MEESLDVITISNLEDNVQFSALCNMIPGMFITNIRMGSIVVKENALDKEELFDADNSTWIKNELLTAFNTKVYTGDIGVTELVQALKQAGVKKKEFRKLLNKAIQCGFFDN